MDKTKKLTISLGIFFSIALILTFFSNTIYNYNLPLVTVMMPGKGKLVHKVTGNSEIAYKDSCKIYSNIEGEIDEIYVYENQFIEKGKAIMKIKPKESVLDELKQNIMKKENEISLASLKLDRLYEDYSKYIEEFEIQNSEMEKLNFEIKGEIRIYKDKIKNAEEEYEKIKKLYEMGAEPHSKLLEQENLIDELKNQYAIFMENEMESFKDTNIAIREAELTIDVLKLELESLNKTLNNYKDNIIYADYTGIINLNKLEKRNVISPNSLIGEIGIISDNYICELNITSKEREKINQNSVVKIKSIGINSEIQGEILSIDKIDGTDMFEIRIGIISSEKLSGQSCKITIETSSDVYNVLVENSAVRKDSDGFYIFVLKKEEENLGKRYVVKRVDIELLDSDEKYSAIEGLQLLEPIVVKSDKNIYNGNRVRYEEKQ
jgi:multidrug efflux pump subunit AcrA (membrane-fusion protein)